jgi:hypothetical protein
MGSKRIPRLFSQGTVMTRNGRARIIIAAAPLVFMARECAANVAPIPMFFLLSGGFIVFLFGLIISLTPIIPLAAFGIWLRARYKLFFGDSCAVRACCVDVIFICVFVFLTVSGIFAVSSSYILNGNKAALALIPILIIPAGSFAFAFDAVLAILLYV